MEKRGELYALMQRAFESAAPYLADFNKVRELINRVLSNVNSIEELYEEIRQLMLGTRDVEFRTDLRILLNMLEKEISRLVKEDG